MAPTNTAYTQWSCYSGLANPVQIVSTPPAPSNGSPITVFRQAGHADQLDGWQCSSLKWAMSRLTWICDICHTEIQVRKQIAIRCNRIEHWVHLRCAGIRQAQHTDTWTCHPHRESRLATHTYITIPWPKPPTHSPPTPHTPPQPKHRNISHFPHVPPELVKPKPC